MKSIIILFFITGVAFFSCVKNSSQDTLSFKATVLGKNIDCGIHQLKFTDNLEEVIKLVGSSPQNIYIAENLPDSLKVEGIKIILNIRKPQGSEIVPCTSFGPTLTLIHVIGATKFY
ncbi:MAG TPA: hypothetical protein PKM76_12495 [Bacteroidales bacterium]|jgi:hypothetical protein|nr:hypothetical protein [Bacteroidales bacterium]